MIINFSVLDSSWVGKRVEVGGYINSIRDHGGLIFIDLRSETELLQCVIDPNDNPEAFKTVEHLSPESVLKLNGQVLARDSDLVNPKLATGEIEVRIEFLSVISRAKVLPYDLHADEKNLAGEETRLKYRYLDLRRPKIKEMLRAKHKLFLAVRKWFDQEGFLEVQTPVLANSSPEGARDYLVPSRLHPGKFYALPQAPQQFKQLLMVGGFNKYFQIAPCFRDEDPRADRHPGDFYQIDAEIAWADQEQIFNLNERLVKEVLVSFSDKKLQDGDKPFTRLTYQESMDKYGSDKPDLRYGLVWQDAKGIFRGSGFKVFADLCDNPKSKVQALVIKGQVDKFSRSDLDKIQDIGRNFGLPGIAYIQYFQDGPKSPVFKFLGEEKAQELQKFFQAEIGDLILFIANSDKSVVWKAQDQMRQHIAKKLDLIDDTLLKFVWIYDFPFFEIDEKSGEIDFGHNPFSMWQEFEGKTKMETLIEAREKNLLSEIKAIQYDCTVNGYEALSGGVRNPFPDCLTEAFRTVGYTQEEIKNRFGHMMEAYTYGAPEHAGFAWGLDRLFMVISGEDNIRETIAFPKNGSGMDVMLNSPTTVGENQLKELGIKLLR